MQDNRGNFSTFLPRKGLLYGLFALLIYTGFLALLSSLLALSSYEKEVIFRADFTLSSALYAAALQLGEGFARGLSIAMCLGSALLCWLHLRARFERFAFASRAAALGAAVFALSPGVIASALLLDGSIMLIFSLLLLGFCRKNAQFALGFLIIFFISPASIWLFLGALVYFHLRRNNFLFLLSLLLLAASAFVYGLDFSGKPRSYILQYIGLCAAVFSPPLFMYYFYFIYDFIRRGGRVINRADLLACTSAVVFVFSLLLSLRQKPEAALFLPYLPIATAAMCEHFIANYYLHIRANRRRYRLAFAAVFAVLLGADLFILLAGLEHAEFLSAHLAAE